MITPARSAVTPWRYAAVLVVLAGLFLMHGMSSAAAGCHGGDEAGIMPMAASAAVEHPLAAAMTTMSPVADVRSATETATSAEDTHSQSADTCVPLRPEDASAVGLPVLGVVLAFGLWLYGGSHPGSPAGRRRSDAGPPRGSGTALLVNLCISRT